MDKKLRTTVKMPAAPSAKEKGTKAPAGSDQKTNDALSDPEPYDSEAAIRKRQLPGSSSRKILDDEAEVGQPVMRSEHKKATSEEKELEEAIFWPGFTDDEESGHRKSASPFLKVTKWDTADLHRGENVTYIILAMKDFVLYGVYLSTLLLLVFGSHDNAYNYYATVVSDIVTKSEFRCNFSNVVTIETFETIKSERQIWCFIDEVFLPFLYPQNKTTNWLLEESVLVGVPALVQIRVKNGTCQTSYMFEGVYKTCYDYYNDRSEDRSTYGEGTTPFRWRPVDLRVGAGSITGRGFEVPGGYQFDFTTDYNFTKSWLKELEHNLWIRQGTRVVVLDFTLYAPDTNLFLVSKLVFEVLPAGGVYTNSFFYTWKILRYVSAFDFFLMSCEVLNFMFVLYFTYEEATQIWILGGEYLTNWWNVLDLTIISLSYAALLTAAWRYAWVVRMLPDKLYTIHTNVHSNFNELIAIEQTFINIGSILVFFAWFKIFKFATLFKSATLFLTTIERVGGELMFLFYQAMIISIGFAVLGQIMFGEHITQFATIIGAFFSMIGIYVGRMHFYRKCLMTHPIIGPLYFGSYIILVCMLHVNAFVGVIVHGYRDAYNKLNEEPQKQYLGDLLFNASIQLLMRVGSDRLLRTMLVKDIINRRQIDYDEFILILKRHGLHGLQLRLLLTHYELKRGNEMHVDKFLEIYNDVLARHQLRVEAIGHDEALQLIEKTDRLLESCTAAMADVQNKVDILIDKLLTESSKELLNAKPKKKKDPVRWW